MFWTFGSRKREFPKKTYFLGLLLQSVEPGQLLEALRPLLLELFQPPADPLHRVEGGLREADVALDISAAGEPLGALLQVGEGAGAVASQLVDVLQVQGLGDLPAR